MSAEKQTKGKKTVNSGLGTRDSALSKVKAFYEFMVRHELENMEIDEPGLRLRLVRRKAAAPALIPVPVPMPMPGMAAAYPAQVPAAGSAHPNPAADPLPPGTTTIKAAMMGIFYRAASPSSPPFVKEGEEIKAGHVICMIEAMKVFNEIKTEFPCKIIKAPVENGKPVKTGQTLFIVQRL